MVSTLLINDSTVEASVVEAFATVEVVVEASVVEAFATVEEITHCPMVGSQVIPLEQHFYPTHVAYIELDFHGSLALTVDVEVGRELAFICQSYS